MKKKLDYLGLNVEFCSHEQLINELRELTKDKTLTPEDKWVYRINEGKWVDKGKSVYDVTTFLYTHKEQQDLLESYKKELQEQS